ncbi:hypothetical protein GPX89_33985 [Nocardia sp. ET3-3]|uniref:Uncharacterized protein n=1 Tax=Nocardia terrae TaxID=2675851 RepID=A0A7K1V6H0_9NOCA|nr:hypothetical protein [Nocardia terrae]MVU82234.1 hypothetical protein [Nocardia terrae]
MLRRLRPALMAAALLMAPLATGTAVAQAAPPTGPAGITATGHREGGQDGSGDQGGPGDQGGQGGPGGQNGQGGQGGFGGQGDFWFDHHCRQLHEWWQPRCRRDGGDMWHRGEPPSIGSW